MIALGVASGFQLEEVDVETGKVEVVGSVSPEELAEMLAGSNDLQQIFERREQDAEEEAKTAVITAQRRPWQ